MVHTFSQAFRANFLGQAPGWYKQTIIAFLILNPILMAVVDPFVVGWVLILEFIFTLAMALKCYPLQPGGLLAIEALIIGLTDPHLVYHEVEKNLPVIILLMFMVAGIYFMKDMLLFVFTKLILKVRSKMLLSFLFSFAAAVLSAFLDALTVTAVIIAVAVGFYGVYHRCVSSPNMDDHIYDRNDDGSVEDERREDLEQFRAYLRSLMMHGAVGTALGGVTTLVGEPQNLLLAKIAGWEFVEFFLRVAPVSMPVLVVGLITCLFLEKTKIFGYGATLPDSVREVLADFDRENTEKRTKQDTMKLIIQGVVALLLVVALGLHLAEPGIIGLGVIVLTTAFNGIIDEHKLGHAFEEALPFTSLLVVFFAIVAVIESQHLFQPITDILLQYEGGVQATLFYVANGVLSMISDNVFVATVYAAQVETALANGIIDRAQFDTLIVAINTGTNIPSVATPNGQAAFLFLLTSALAPLIRLSYGRMVVMALPYTITMSITGLIAVMYIL
ncbi:MAG: sodium/proton antiporter NhaB [Pseudomonadota bacterium]